MGFRILLFMLLLHTAARLVGSEESVIVGEQLFDYSYTMRVKAASEYNERVGNPVAWLPVSFLVDDGSRVEVGDVIAKFETGSAEHRLQDLKLERDYVEADLLKRLTDIDNVELDTKSRLEELADLLVVAEAELVSLLAMPDEDEVRLEEGRMRVARLNFEAAEKDLAKAESRFERKLISRTQLENVNRMYSERRALLEFAIENYEYAQLAAASSTIRRKELEIENLKLEIAKFEHELAEQAEIAVIRKDGAKTQKRSIDKKIQVKQGDIDSAVVTSPIDGYISHRLTNHTPLRLGDKMWRGYNFMSIPDLSKMVLRGGLPEPLRRYFAVGDRATVVLAGQEDRVIEGRIKAVSQLPRDLAEVEESTYGQEAKEFGVKVYDVTVAIDAPSTDLKPGRQGYATLRVSQPVKRPALPLRYVKSKDEQFYLSVDGDYQPVSGVAYQGMFFLEDDAWLGKRVDLRGNFAPAPRAGAEQETTRFTATGEVLPVRTEEVTVGAIGGWYKIKWLIPEESAVKQGDLVAQIDTTEIDKKIEEGENAVNQAQSDLDEKKKNLELKQQEEAFKLNKAERLLEIAELRMNTVLRGRDYPAIFQAQLNLQQAKIQLQDLTQRLAAQEAKARLTISPFEFEKLQRDVRRVQLQVEKHTIHLAQLQAGADAVEVSQAKLDYLNQKVEVERMKNQIAYERERADLELEEEQLDLRSKQLSLKKRLAEKARTNLYAPVDGFIQYNKILNSGGVSKISVGSMVGSRFRIMSLPDMRSMYLSVEVPEHYYLQVKQGMLVDVVIPSLDNRILQGHISGVDLLFENKERKGGQVGLYSSQEPLGEVVFKVRVDILDEHVPIKPGVIGEVKFDFVGMEGDA